MGCASARGHLGSGVSKTDDDAIPTEQSVSDPGSVGSMWATPSKPATNLSPEGDSKCVVTSCMEEKQMSPRGEKQDQSMVMTDALDDDDEVEIIYETAPKYHAQQRHPQEPQMRVAASGQEPPGSETSTVDSPRRKVEAEKTKDVPKEAQLEVLSKSQQEEAAKLAERRKKFDAARYQRDQSASDGPVFNRPMEAKAPNPLSSQVVQAAPTADMIFGLNSPAAKDHRSQQDSLEDIPGGIIDDMKIVQPVVQNRNHHAQNDVDCIGLDAVDEQIMKDIVEDFDDV